jgi:hypothetical protein
MRTWKRLLAVSALLALFSFTTGFGCQHSSGPSEPEDELAATIYLDSHATYLHTNNDPGAVDAEAVRLADHGIDPGELIAIYMKGGFNNGYAETQAAVGVFSSSNVLLDQSELNRVQGAIDAGNDYFTPATLSGGEPTDIAEDFNCCPDVCLYVPSGANYLFVSAQDNYYVDNSDDGGDFRFQLWKRKD